MITAKQLYGTPVHKQLRAYINANFHPAIRPRELGQLTVKFLRALNSQHPARGWIPDNVDEAFLWNETVEGHEFWSNVHNTRVVAGQPLPQPRPLPGLVHADDLMMAIEAPIGIHPNEADVVPARKVAEPKAPKPAVKIGWW